MPIITTAVDGLDEMFTDEVTALKVPVHFSPAYGLRAEVKRYARQMTRLIEDADLRKRLGIHARKMYEERFGLELMMRKHKDHIPRQPTEYKSIINGSVCTHFRLEDMQRRLIQEVGGVLKEQYIRRVNDERTRDVRLLLIRGFLARGLSPQCHRQ